MVRITSRNPKKIAANDNLVGGFRYSTLICYEKMLSTLPVNWGKDGLVGLSNAGQAVRIAAAVVEDEARSITRALRRCRADNKYCNENFGLPEIKRRVIDAAHSQVNKHLTGRSSLRFTTDKHISVVERTKWNRQKEYTVGAPVPKIYYASFVNDEFDSFMTAMVFARKYTNVFIACANKPYVEESETMGKLKYSYVAHFTAGVKNKGIEWSWCCMSSKENGGAIGLGEDPVAAEKAMIRCAAMMVRDKIREGSKD